MKAAMSAIFSGRSMRFFASSEGGFVLCDHIWVATGPGLMEDMRMPVPRYSWIKVSVKAFAAYLDAE